MSYSDWKFYGGTQFYPEDGKMGLGCARVGPVDRSTSSGPPWTCWRATSLDSRVGYDMRFWAKAASSSQYSCKIRIGFGYEGQYTASTTAFVLKIGSSLVTLGAYDQPWRHVRCVYWLDEAAEHYIVRTYSTDSDETDEELIPWTLLTESSMAIHTDPFPCIGIEVERGWENNPRKGAIIDDIEVRSLVFD